MFGKKEKEPGDEIVLGLKIFTVGMASLVVFLMLSGRVIHPSLYFKDGFGVSFGSIPLWMYIGVEVSILVVALLSGWYVERKSRYDVESELRKFEEEHHL